MTKRRTAWFVVAQVDNYQVVTHNPNIKRRLQSQFRSAFPAFERQPMAADLQRFARLHECEVIEILGQLTAQARSGYGIPD